MKNKEIRDLFPRDFYGKKKDDILYSEMSIIDLTKIIDYICKLEERIEKAVEYIKEHTFQEEIGFDNKKGEIHYGYFVECKAKELLNILEGEEK